MPAQAQRHETRPVATSHDRAWSAPVAPRSSSATPKVVTHPTPAAVDHASYLKEKAAAVRGPAPTGATTVGLPRRAIAQVPTMPVLFDALDRPSAANNGIVFNPPDTIVAKSPNRILEGVNSALRLFNNVGGTLQTADLNTFFGAATTNGRLFDPKTYFDRNAANPRFFVVALQVAGRDDTDPANDVSRIWVAVSRSPDPANLAAGNWCRYNIEGRRNVGAANVSWADYPAIGGPTTGRRAAGGRRGSAWVGRTARPANPCAAADRGATMSLSMGWPPVGRRAPLTSCSPA